jgi:membrane protein
MVFGIGFLLLISLIVSTALALLGTFFSGHLPSLAPLLELFNLGATFGVSILLFAMMFKVLPDTHVKWQDVWIGASLTALLFSIGKSLIGLYLGHASLGSAYGAAGSLVVLSVWIYYSALILFFGAEVTYAYAALRHLASTETKTPMSAETAARAA